MTAHLRYQHLLRDAIRGRLSLRLAVVVVLSASVARPATSQTVADSLARGLDSASVAVRYDAVAGLSLLALSSIPATVRSRLIALLEAEGVALKTMSIPEVEPDTSSSEELYPGYLTALTTVVLQFADVRSLRGLALAGLGVNRDVQNFVVAHAAESLPFLDEAFTSPRAQHSVLLTWGLMLGASTTALTSDQQQTIRRRLFASSSSDPLEPISQTVVRG